MNTSLINRLKEFDQKIDQKQKLIDELQRSKLAWEQEKLQIESKIKVSEERAIFLEAEIARMSGDPGLLNIMAYPSLDISVPIQP